MNKRNHGETSSRGGFGVKGSGKCSSSSSSVKAKMWDEEQDASGGMDELLVVLGYKVKASEMANVAEKLEMVMGTTPNLSCDSTVHYNPSDLSGWVQSMLSELNNPNPNLDPLQPIVESPVLVPSPTTTTIDSLAINNVAGFSNSQVDDSKYNLRAILGSAVYPQTDISEGSRKRFKSSTGSCSLLPSSSSLSSSNVCEQTRPVVLVDL
ncbi:DELLA protein GAI-like [Quercus suber]|uniref:DELLA protein GAI-like n=1 Tax=Quercus suber TaxID=58331 RepID=UPI000D2D9A73|nr:della protein gai [Quercus suber]